MAGRLDGRKIGWQEDWMSGRLQPVRSCIREKMRTIVTMVRRVIPRFDVSSSPVLASLPSPIRQSTSSECGPVDRSDRRLATWNFPMRSNSPPLRPSPSGIVVPPVSLRFAGLPARLRSLFPGCGCQRLQILPWQTIGPNPCTRDTCVGN